MTKRTAAAAAAFIAVAQLTAQSGPSLDLGTVRPGGTLRGRVSVVNNCESAKTVTITHNVPHLSMLSSVVIPPGPSTIDLMLAPPAGARGAISGAITFTFAGDATCHPRAATLVVSAAIGAAGAPQPAAAGAPQSESWYEDATGAYDEGRELADDAKTREEAQAALDRLKAASEALDAGVAAGDIGPETASVLRQAIEDAMETALAVLEGDDPRDEPPPVIYGEELDDSVEEYDGAFEPTQGVWQDDEDFADFPGKQLTRVGPAHYKAELKMIVGRPAFLIGIRGSRDTIYFTGKANGSVNVQVKARFTLVQGGFETRLHETQPLPDLVALDGAASGAKPFHVRVMATNGVPSGKPFRRFKPGAYQIRAELIRADTNVPTGIRVTVDGDAVETTAPTVLFVPAKLNPWGAGVTAPLEAAAGRLAETSKTDVPVWFPMKPNSLQTATGPLQDLERAVRDARRRARRPDADQFRTRRDAMAAALAETFGTISVLGGYGRTFVILDDYDFDQTIDALPDGGRAQAYAMSRKVMVGRQTTTTSDVAHELAHTFPFSWADKQMLGMFQKNWHNKTDRIANGIEASGFRRDKQRTIMGPSGGLVWIEQGTYWHLIDFLQTPVDPELLLVRGLLTRGRDGFRADLAAGYQLLGDADLTAGVPSPTQFAIVLRDASGAVLARFPFDPDWTQPDVPVERTVVSFLYRVPDMPGIASVDVTAPGGQVLVSRRLSAAAPVLSVLTPADGQPATLTSGRLRISWRASDADRDALLYTVMYSADGGRRWRVVSHEQSATSLDLPLSGRPRDGRIRVIATDGMRSATRDVAFRLR